MHKVTVLQWQCLQQKKNDPTSFNMRIVDYIYIVLVFIKHGHFIWSLVPMLYSCYTYLIIVSYLPYHIIIFKKLLMSPYTTHTHVHTP